MKVSSSGGRPMTCMPQLAVVDTSERFTITGVNKWLMYCIVITLMKAINEILFQLNYSEKSHLDRVTAKLS